MREKLTTYFCRLKDVLQDDWQYEKAGSLILFVSILCILILPCILTCYIPFEEYSWWNTFEKFINEHPLYTNIIGTFIGVIIIFIILRPRVRIIEELENLTIKSNKHLKVRVENLGIFPVNDVEVQLLYYWTSVEGGKDIYHTKQIELLRQGAPILHGVFPKGRDTTYGCVTKLAIEELKRERYLKLKKKKEYEGILCRVKATHAISGVTYVREHKFEKDVVDKFFEKNRSSCVEKNASEKGCDEFSAT